MSIFPRSPHLERTRSSLRYVDDRSRVTLTACTPRIVRVERAHRELTRLSGGAGDQDHDG